MWADSDSHVASRKNIQEYLLETWNQHYPETHKAQSLPKKNPQTSPNDNIYLGHCASHARSQEFAFQLHKVTICCMHSLMCVCRLHRFQKSPIALLPPMRKKIHPSTQEEKDRLHGVGSECVCESDIIVMTFVASEPTIKRKKRGKATVASTK